MSNPHDVRQTLGLGLTQATPIGLSPRWVQYSGVSTAARAIAEVLTDLVTMSGALNQAAILDRELIAYLAGYSRADKIAPFLAELEKIGFLTIYSGRVDPTTGKRRQLRDTTGRPVQDRFVISLRVPAGYEGPEDLTEAFLEFQDDCKAAYETARTTKKGARTGNVAIPRTKVGRFAKPQVSTEPQVGGQLASADPSIGGQLAFLQVSTEPQVGGQLASADPSIGGQLAFLQVSTEPQVGGHPQKDQIDLSPTEREIEMIEPVPGGAAKPPATGKDLDAVDWRAIIGGLGWEEWASRQNVGKVVLGPQEVRQIRLAMTAAMARHGLTPEQVRTIGTSALKAATSNPAVFVTGAYSESRISSYLEDEPMEFLSAKLTKPATGSAITLVAEKRRPLPACDSCRASAGEPAHMRVVLDDEGHSKACPSCVAAGVDFAGLRAGYVHQS